MNNHLIDWAFARARGEDTPPPEASATELKCAHSDLAGLARVKREQYQRLQAELQLLDAAEPHLMRAIETATMSDKEALERESSREEGTDV